jgi:hypothetical protein
MLTIFAQERDVGTQTVDVVEQTTLWNKQPFGINNSLEQLFGANNPLK